MTGQDVLTQALKVLTYTNRHGEIDTQRSATIFKRSLPILNQVYSDLYRIEGSQSAFSPLQDINSMVFLSDVTCRDVMPYGVAMWISQAEGDGDNQAVFSALYNQKRSSVKRPVESRQDVLPIGDDWG